MTTTISWTRPERRWGMIYAQINGAWTRTRPATANELQAHLESSMDGWIAPSGLTETLSDWHETDPAVAVLAAAVQVGPIDNTFAAIRALTIEMQAASR